MALATQRHHQVALSALNPIGKEFYVWPGVGSDTTDGLSPDTALATIKAAHDQDHG